MFKNNITIYTFRVIKLIMSLFLNQSILKLMIIAWDVRDDRSPKYTAGKLNPHLDTCVNLSEFMGLYLHFIRNRVGCLDLLQLVTS